MTIYDSRRSDIWVYDWSRDALSRLTLHPYSSFKPVWTADGSRVAFTMTRSGDVGVFNIAWQRADGSGELQRLTQGANAQAAGSFHPTGRYLALMELDSKTSFDIKVMPIGGDEPSGWKPEAARDFVKTPAVELEPMFSPDGRWIAYASNESGRFEVYVRPFPGSGGVWQISRGGGTYPTWSQTGRSLIYATLDQRLMSVDYETDGRSFNASTPRFWTEKRHQVLGPVVARNYDLHPDGKRIAMSAAPDEHAAGDRVVVITGFVDDLKRRVR
jgi:serine/threonine-protein kinase